MVVCSNDPKTGLACLAANFKILDGPKGTASYRCCSAGTRAPHPVPQDLEYFNWTPHSGTGAASPLLGVQSLFLSVSGGTESQFFWIISLHTRRRELWTRHSVRLIFLSIVAPLDSKSHMVLSRVEYCPSKILSVLEYTYKCSRGDAFMFSGGGSQLAE